MLGRSLLHQLSVRGPRQLTLTSTFCSPPIRYLALDLKQAFFFFFLLCVYISEMCISLIKLASAQLSALFFVQM